MPSGRRQPLHQHVSSHDPSFLLFMQTYRKGCSACDITVNHHVIFAACIDSPPSTEEKPQQESLSVLDSEQFSSQGSTEQSQKDNENDMMASTTKMKYV